MHSFAIVALFCCCHAAAVLAVQPHDDRLDELPQQAQSAWDLIVNYPYTPEEEASDKASDWYKNCLREADENNMPCVTVAPFLGPDGKGCGTEIDMDCIIEHKRKEACRAARDASFYKPAEEFLLVIWRAFMQLKNADA